MEGDPSNVEGSGIVPPDGCDNKINEGGTTTATQIEDTITSEGNNQNVLNGEDQNVQMEAPPSLRRSNRNRSQPVRFNDFVVGSNVKYGLEKYVSYANLSRVNMCFSTTLNKSCEPKSLSEADELTTKKLVCLFSSANSGHAQASVCNIVATVHPEAAGALRQECMAFVTRCTSLSDNKEKQVQVREVPQERREKPAKHATEDSGKSKRTSGKKNSKAKSSFYDDYIVSIPIYEQVSWTPTNLGRRFKGCPPRKCEVYGFLRSLSFFVRLVAFIWGQSLEAILGVLVIVIVDTIFALINMIVEIQRGGRVAEVDDKLAWVKGKQPLIDDAEGLEKTENLHSHDNNEMYDKAFKILEAYWLKEEIKLC
ncbi:Armadillo-like helical [Artemisia annua]|uniref:Armadillo-like helical n=1 Tax=Artemisia annua TaxID=35608 RepID=A0A2U1NB71_ARTAN|nr:Armadillo-like helical [Artemisia annua]